jgi:hypothetical protein
MYLFWLPIVVRRRRKRHAHAAPKGAGLKATEAS